MPESVWSPSTCPLRISVTRLHITDTSGEVREVEIDSRNSRGQAAMVGLLLAALDNPQILDTYRGLRDDPQERHPDNCPLCALHARPGPRVWGCWITASWQGDPVYGDYGHGRRPVHRGIELFGNLAHARESMTHAARHVTTSRRDRAQRTWTLADLRAWTDTPPDYDTRLVTETSQLWLWHNPPTGRWWPDLVLSFTDDWTVHEMTGAALRHQHATGQIPSGVLSDPVPAEPPDTLDIGGYTVRCLGSGADLAVVSIRDTTSTAPARRVLPDGAITDLPGTPAGLTVYGRWIHERPAVSQIPSLTPEYSALVPAIRERFAARGR